jgi:MFS superfamily sulfate permease-like transporter
MGAEKLDSHSLPLLRGVLPIDTNNLVSDIVAGVTLAALGIPEVMGYTKISGTPIVTGLYTLLLPVIAFALLGGSRHLVVAADSATAAILASILRSSLSSVQLPQASYSTSMREVSPRSAVFQVDSLPWHCRQ